MLALDMEDFVFIDSEATGDSEAQTLMRATVNAGMVNLGLLFQSLAEKSLCLSQDVIADFNTSGLNYAVTEDEESSDFSARLAATVLIKNIIVYLTCTDLEAEAQKLISTLFVALSKSLEADTAENIRVTESCLYFFQHSVKEVKEVLDYTSIVALIDFSKQYPNIITYRILEFLGAFVETIPFVSANVHEAIHGYVAKNLEDANSIPVVKLACIKCLISVLTKSKQSILQKINLTLFLSHFEKMIQQNFSENNDQQLLLFGNLFLKLVQALKDNIVSCIDQIFSIVIFMNTSYCQGSLVKLQRNPKHRTRARAGLDHERNQQGPETWVPDHPSHLSQASVCLLPSPVQRRQLI